MPYDHVISLRNTLSVRGDAGAIALDLRRMALSFERAAQDIDCITDPVAFDGKPFVLDNAGVVNDKIVIIFSRGQS